MNMHRAPARRQRGATLLMGIIFLTLLMLSVTVAFRMSNNNLKAVGSMQSQEEAEASAKAAIERVISSDTLFVTPAVTNVATDAYGVAVAVAAPVCLRSVPVDASNSADANPNIYLEGISLTSGYVETHWDVAATATSAATGAKVVVHQGVKIIMEDEPNPCP
jgi:Tfp pilus assembly protein PilX